MATEVEGEEGWGIVGDGRSEAGCVAWLAMDVMVEGALPLLSLVPLDLLGSELQKENETYINAVNHFKAFFLQFAMWLSCKLGWGCCIT